MGDLLLEAEIASLSVRGACDEIPTGPSATDVIQIPNPIFDL